MIRKLVISNYRSLGENVELTLGPLTALVGPNGSGKSNVGDALRFLAHCLQTGLDSAIGWRNGMGALRRWSSGDSREVALSIEVANSTGEGLWSFRVASDAAGDFWVKEELAHWKPVSGIRQAFAVKDGTWKVHPHGLAPELGRTALALPLVAGDERFSPLAAEVRNLHVYQILPAELRIPSRGRRGPPLAEDGGNWAVTLKTMDEAIWKPDLLAALARIVGDIDDIKVSEVGSFLAVSLRHGEQGGRERWFDAAQESDGTLRCAGILTALLQSPPPTLVGIEEPELSVHPGAIPVLHDFFRQAARTSQVLLTTHSPELLDLLDVEEVRVVARQEGVTRIAPLAGEQREAVRRALLTPGELMRAEGLRPEEH